MKKYFMIKAEMEGVSYTFNRDTRKEADEFIDSIKKPIEIGNKKCQYKKIKLFEVKQIKL